MKITYWGWSDKGQKDWKESEAVENSENDDEEVHTEVVKSEQGGWSESKHNNTKQFGRSNSSYNGTSHVIHCDHSSLPSCSLLSQEIHANMVAEFDTETNACNQVDHEDGVDLDWVATDDDVHHPHDTHELEEHHENAKGNNQSDPETGDELHGDDNGAKTHKHILEHDAANIGILVIVYVVKRVCESCWCL